MTAKETYNTFGYEFTYTVPGSVAEYDQNANRVDGCLADAIDHTVFHRSLTKIRDGVVDRVVKESGIEIRMKDSGKKNEKGEAVMVQAEKDPEYLERVRLENKWSEDGEDNPIGKWVQEVADSIPFDASARVRSAPGPKELPKKYKELATGYFQKGKAEAIAVFINNQCGYTTVLTGDAEKDIEALGWAMKAHASWKEKQAQAEFASV